jgi:hypothetical protein
MGRCVLKVPGEFPTSGTNRPGVWKLVHAHQSPLGGAVITEKHQQRFDTVVKTLAQPYALDREFKITKISYPQGFSTAAGLISTVLDMAKYDIAIDQNKFPDERNSTASFHAGSVN